MPSSSLKVLDTFIADGSVATYTSQQHTEVLAGGRSVSFLITATNYDDDTYLDVFLETSVDGRNFQSKYVTYVSVTGGEGAVPTALLAHHKLVYTVSGSVVYPIVDAVVAAEPTPAKPSHRHARLRLQLTNDKEDTGKSARLVVHATIRGAPTVDDDAVAAPARVRSAPGSLARQGEMNDEVKRLARAASALPESHRASYILNNLSQSSREHVREVDRQLRALPADTRKAVIASAADGARRAVALGGGIARKPPAPEEPCCAGETKSGPPGAAPCGGGCA